MFDFITSEETFKFISSGQFVITMCVIALIVLFILLCMTIRFIVEWLDYKEKSDYLKSNNFDKYVVSNRNIWIMKLSKDNQVKISDKKVDNMSMNELKCFINNKTGRVMMCEK
jgi:hypothetical protein